MGAYQLGPTRLISAIDVGPSSSRQSQRPTVCPDQRFCFLDTRRIAPRRLFVSASTGAVLRPLKTAQGRLLPSASTSKQQSPLRSSSLAVTRSLITAMANSASVAASKTPHKANPYSEFVLFAHALADEARTIIPKYFRQKIHIECKSDESPVTVADREVERALRAAIIRKYPSHWILGEEDGVKSGDSSSIQGMPEYTWVIDPIDGTASFITGKPLFGVLISLLHRGVPVVGILDQPILEERWVGVQGLPTTFNGVPVKTRTGVRLSEAYFHTTSPHQFLTPEARKAFEAIRCAAKRADYGCDCYAFGLLALGFVDVALEYDAKVWDFLALVPIVTGAGGVMTDWEGNALRLHSLDLRSRSWNYLACGSKRLHSVVLDMLSTKP